MNIKSISPNTESKKEKPAAKKPEKGKYKFISPHQASVCVKHANTGKMTVVGQCLERETKTYEKGDVVEIKQFSFHNGSRTALINFKGKNLPVPMSKLKKVSNDEPTSSKSNEEKSGLAKAGILGNITFKNLAIAGGVVLIAYLIFK